MRSAKSTKEPHLIRYGLWKMSKGLIKTAEDFQIERNELYRMNLDQLIEEIKKRKSQIEYISSNISPDVWATSEEE